MDFNDNKYLIEQLRKGEERAYMYLLETYHRRLHSYAMTMVDDVAMAQDIVQNVFLKTWQFRKKLNSAYSLKSFLYKSVYNEFVNTYKKNQKVSLLEQKYMESLAEVVEGIDEGAMERMIAIVSKEVQNLPAKCQKIFVLSKHEGLTNIEISEYLNVSLKTVEAQITKAFSILRQKLGEKYETILFLLFGNLKNI